MSERQNVLDDVEAQRRHWSTSLKEMEQAATELPPAARDLVDLTISEAQNGLETLSEKCEQAKSADKDDWSAIRAELERLSDSAGSLVTRVGEALSKVAPEARQDR